MVETINLEKLYRELMLLRREVDVIKSQMINEETLIVDEGELNPEFIKKISEIEKQKSIKVDDFSKRYGLN